MNILVVVKLSENKLQSKLMPFQMNPDIEKIYVLRDNPCNISPFQYDQKKRN